MGTTTFKHVNPFDTVQYDNTIEDQYLLENGVYCGVEYTGDIKQDFASFVKSQGGGKSRCSHDFNLKYMPQNPDKDGKYYHTVDDISYRLFKGLGSKLGYNPTDDLFYEMPEDLHTKIVEYHIEDITGSESIDIFFAYLKWGIGNYSNFKMRYENQYGSILKLIKLHGEYHVFLHLIKEREHQIRISKNYLVMGRGRLSGLAHFHRIFKNYVKN